MDDPAVIQMIPIPVHRLPDGFYELETVGVLQEHGRHAMAIYAGKRAGEFYFTRAGHGGLFYVNVTEIALEIKAHEEAADGS